MPPQDQIRWQSLQFAIAQLVRYTGDEWPPEFAGLSGEPLLQKILSSEQAARTLIDAAIRVSTRSDRPPPLSILEQWHLQHRLVFGEAVCTIGIADNLPFPEVEEAEAAEHLLIESWAQSGATRWAEQMKKASEALRHASGAGPSDPPPTR